MERITRRRFLAGGATAGALAVGGAGFAASQNIHGIRRLLHGRGLLGGPDEAQPDVAANVGYATLGSGSAAVNYGLYLPSAPASVVLYCLHGRGGNRQNAFDGIGVHRFVAARNLPWAVASLDGGEGFWHRRADGSDTQADLIDTLMPFVGSKAPDARSVLMGWSMGGYGALLILLKHRDLFAGAVANGPSIWSSFGAAAPGAFDDEADFAANDVLAGAASLQGAPVRVDCGEDDPFAGAVEELRTRAPGLDVNISDGFHEDATWRSFLPAQLDFIQTHVGD